MSLFIRSSRLSLLGDPVYYVVWFYLGYREKEVIALCKKFKLWNTATALILPLLLLFIFCIGQMIEIKGLSTLLNFILGPLFMFVSLSYFSRLFTKHSSKYLKTCSDYGLGVYLYAEPINYLLLYIFLKNVVSHSLAKNLVQPQFIFKNYSKYCNCNRHYIFASIFQY